MQDSKEEVRSRLNIEDVIGEYVQLKRSGRNFKGLSPFTKEKTPSFYVSPDKQIWHDFSSNKGGDIFAFVMEVEGIDFRGSLEILARKAGVELDLYDNRQAKQVSELKKRLLEANELAAKYYQQSLISNKHAAEYAFKQRGLNKQVVQDFRIGYAPDSKSALMDLLKKKGFTDKELSQAGLANRFGGDLFRGRMMVPLMDGSGQVIGFTGRIIEDSDSQGPKYLNTPQTLIYDKSRHVFGLSQAKPAIREVGYSVVVEGNLDVVSSHQAGVSQVVATAGTAMTEQHLKALVRLSPKVCLSFDSDKAGISATERAVAIAQSVGVELLVVTLPKGYKDPDELVKKDVKLWEQSIKKAESAIDWTLKQYFSREDIKTAAGKRRFTTNALGLIAKLSDPVEREHYMSRVADKTGVSLEALETKLSEDKKDTSSSKLLKPVRVEPVDPVHDPNIHQDSLLAALLINPESRKLLQDLDVEALITGDNRQRVVKYLLKNSQDFPQDIPKELQTCSDYVKILLLQAETRYSGWSKADLDSEVSRLVGKLYLANKQVLKYKLIEQLRDAETLGDDAKAASIRSELNQLIREVKNG